MDFIQMLNWAPFYGVMLETFFLLYGVAIVAGSWLMLTGVSEAPLGYEDEEGFHYLPARVPVKSETTSERAED